MVCEAPKVQPFEILAGHERREQVQDNLIIFPEPPPGDNVLSVTRTLPVSLTSLIGREHEMQIIHALLLRSDVHVLTLTGTAGVGKTRLGLEVAREMVNDFADGVHVISLAPLSDPAFVIPTIAHSLGLSESGSLPVLEQLKVSLRDKQRLLLLDNFEHVIGAATLLVELLEVCPDLKLLVTSREVLRLRGEHQFTVPPLALPDPRQLPDAESLTQFPAVNLFLQRAQAIQYDFQLTADNAATIVEICIRLDGLPLAIELAAARLKLLSPHALLARLDQRLAVLSGGARDAPARQQTLRDTIAWSYQLLDAQEQRLFRRLSIFVGGCTLEGAESVSAALGDAIPSVLDGVASLIDKSLLQRIEQESQEPRLLMLETIREYGLEALEASGEAEAMLRQHATFFLQLAEKAFTKSHSTEQATWFKRLEADHDNLRAALRWTLEQKAPQSGLQLAGALTSFWVSRNHEVEGRSWLEQVLAQPGAEARTRARAQVLRGLGILLIAQGDYSDAQRRLEESVSISREIGPAGTFDLAAALTQLAYVTLLQGNPGDTLELAGESLRLFQELGVTWGIALALLRLGKSTLELGDPGAARPLLEESAKLLREAGDRHLLASPIDALGLLALRQGDDAGARTYFEEALALAVVQETGDKVFAADALAHLGAVTLRQGEYHESATLYQQSLVLNREEGYKVGIIEDLTGLAESCQPARSARASSTATWGNRVLSRSKQHQAFASASC
jgi:predicted ATPase